MPRTNSIVWVAAVTTVVVLAPRAAVAKKKGPLMGEPVVRQKLELRKNRFQLTPTLGMSLSQPFVHKGFVGAKAQFDFLDWIGVRATFAYGVVNVESKLLKALNSPTGGLPRGIEAGTTSGEQACPAGGAPCRSENDTNNPSPLLHDFRAGLTRPQWQSSLDVVFTPFAGKLGLFSALFTEYDMYVFGGLGLMGWEKHYKNRSTAELEGLSTNPGSANYCRKNPGEDPNSECFLHPVKADKGVKVGGSFGLGFHLFFTDWVALNVEVQDIVTRNNLTGLNATVNDAPPVINNRDKDVFHNVTFQLGATFYFAPKAKRSR